MSKMCVSNYTLCFIGNVSIFITNLTINNIVDF